ncbi:hypothetical protein [Buttiauxella gaviniae]|uniref:hypothetical protein n=1 Tax=Buttiauxella gaviniae TaxID=82990 RepID=UPI003C74AECF
MTVEITDEEIALASYQYEIDGTEGRMAVLKSVEVLIDGNDGFYYAVEVFDESDNKIDRQVFDDYDRAVIVYKSFKQLNEI